MRRCRRDERGLLPGTAKASVLLSALLLFGCIDNPAPGNDREARLDPPATPAALVAVTAAIDGVDPGLIMPQTMSEADQRALPDLGDTCRFRMTRVGFPVAVYGSSGVVKLNGRLVELGRSAEGRYGADGVELTVRPLEEQSTTELFEAEMVLRLPGAPNELGFHGYGECRA